MFHPEPLLYKMIQCIEVHISEKLTRQVADRNATAAKQWRKQIVAREILDDLLLLVGMVNDKVTEPQDLRIFNSSSYALLEDGVVQCGEKLMDIHFEHITGRAYPGHELLQSAMSAFASAAGIAVVN